MIHQKGSALFVTMLGDTPFPTTQAKIEDLILTTMRETTMTTNFKVTRKIAANLFDRNEIFNLERLEGCLSSVAGISFVAKRISHKIPWPDVLRASVERVIALLRDTNLRSRHIYFFGANDSWKIASVVNTYRGFWRANPHLEEIRIGRASKEVKFENGAMMRFCVMAEISVENIYYPAEWIRARRSGFMLLVVDRFPLDEKAVRTWFENAFSDGQSSINWSKLASRISGTDLILLRCSGAFDDPDASVDLIFDPERTRID